MSSVQVAVRCRPLNDRELNTNARVVVRMQGKQVFLTDPDKSGPDAVRPFTFDRAYWSVEPSHPEFASQEKVFSDLGETVLQNAAEGYNSAVLAYGQTGSGKSYSMMGTDSDKGIIPRLCEALFKRIESNTDPNTTFKVEVSYLEIYCEKIKDLLNPTMKGHTCKVREHPVLGPYVEDLSKLLVTTFEEIQRLMDDGNKSRTVAATAMNSVSSRSHAIFTIVFTQIKFDPEVKLSSEKTSKISLVDLAGSERAGKSGTTGDRLKEGANINQSLTTLGLVIKALAESNPEKGKQPFVPYRDSVLTWLLKDTLGGNSKTIMIATLSPSALNYEETLSTLRYANSAKNIVNRAVVNEDANAKIIRELKEEISRLKEQLASGDGSSTVTMVVAPDPNQVAELEMLRDQLKESERLISELSMTWEEKLRNSQKLQEERKAVFKAMGIKVTVEEDGLPYFLNLNEDPLFSEVLLYELRPGLTRLGRADAAIEQDIALVGPDIHPQHAIIQNNPASGVFVIPFGVDDEVWSTTSLTTDVTESVSSDQTQEESADLDQDPTQPEEDNETDLPQQSNNIVASPMLSESVVKQISEVPLITVNGRLIRERVQLRQGQRISFGKIHVFRFNHPAEAARMRLERLANMNFELASPSVMDSSMDTSALDSSTVDSSMLTVDSNNDAVVDAFTNIYMEAFTDRFAAESDEASPVDLEPPLEIHDPQLKTTELHARVRETVGSFGMIEENPAIAEEEHLQNQNLMLDHEQKVRELEMQKMQLQQENEKLEESRLLYEAKIKELLGNQQKSVAIAENNVQVLIPSFLLVADSPKKSHYEYAVEVNVAGERWVVMRRYNEFLELHHKLKKQIQIPAFLMSCFPKKALGLKTQNESFAEARRERLQTYLRGIVLEIIRQPFSTLKDNLTRETLCEALPFLSADYNFDKRLQQYQYIAASPDQIESNNNRKLGRFGSFARSPSFSVL